jgi:Secretion system C-terminal sorting domain
MMKKGLLIIALFFGVLGSAFSQYAYEAVEKLENPTFMEVHKVLSDEFAKEETSRYCGYKQFKRWEDFWYPRMMNSQVMPDPARILSQYQEWEEKYKEINMLEDKVWELKGPIFNPESETGTSVREQGLGRINCIVFHPDDTDIIFAGAASGGLWKSTNNGESWVTYPFTEFMGIGVSDFAIAASNTDVWYCCTGDADGSNSASGAFYSIGLIKTTDAGKNWSVCEGLNLELQDRRLLTKVLIDPEDENILVVSTSMGIYKSLDGGITWEQKGNAKYYKDLKQKPGDFNTMIASSYIAGDKYAAIYYSSDAGETWEETHYQDESNRIALAYSESDPSIAYALCSRSGTNSFKTFLASDDGGKTWEETRNNTQIPNILGRHAGTGDDAFEGQGFYDLTLTVSPVDDGEVYTGGINIWKSDDNGYEFELISHWWGWGGLPLIHADQHCLTFKPGTNELYAGHDGGIDRINLPNGEWEGITDHMSITQFYRISTAQTVDNSIYAGCQDNGTRQYLKNSTYPNSTWLHRGSADGMECAIDPKNEQRVIKATQNGSFQYSLNGGTKFSTAINTGHTKEDASWVAPLAIDPDNTDIVYIGHVNLYRSTDFAKKNSFQKISLGISSSSPPLRNIAIAPSNPNTLYCSNYSNLFKVTNAQSEVPDVEILPSPGYPLTRIIVDPTNSDRFWVTKSGYSQTSRVLEFMDGAWTDITGNLPAIPVNCIALQEGDHERIYVGTDIGVFYTENGSRIWRKHGVGLPNVVVYDLEIQKNTQKLIAGTFGRGVWTIDLNDCEFELVEIARPSVEIICPGDTLIFEAPSGFAEYKWTNGDTTRVIEVTERGAYGVSCLKNDGCFASSVAVDIIEYNVPGFSLSTDGTQPCYGDTIDIKIQGFGFESMVWDDGFPDKKRRVFESGYYSATAISKDGCVTKEEVDFVFHDKPGQPVIHAWSNKLGIEGVKGARYQWYLDGIKISRSDSSIYEIEETGKYKVEVIDSNGCRAMSDEYDAITSVEENELASIRVYPNPSGDIFNLDLFVQSEQRLKVVITDLLGNKILDIPEINASERITKQIDLSGMPAGIYLANIRIGSYSKVIKLIKK